MEQECLEARATPDPPRAARFNVEEEKVAIAEVMERKYSGKAQVAGRVVEEEMITSFGHGAAASLVRARDPAIGQSDDAGRGQPC